MELAIIIALFAAWVFGLLFFAMAIMFAVSRATRRFFRESLETLVLGVLAFPYGLSVLAYCSMKLSVRFAWPDLVGALVGLFTIYAGVRLLMIAKKLFK